MSTGRDNRGQEEFLAVRYVPAIAEPLSKDPSGGGIWGNLITAGRGSIGGIRKADSPRELTPDFQPRPGSSIPRESSGAAIEFDTGNSRGN